MKQYILYLCLPLSVVAMENNPNAAETPILFHRSVPKLVSLALSRAGDTTVPTETGISEPLAREATIPQYIRDRFSENLYRAFIYRHFSPLHVQRFHAEYGQHAQLRPPFQELIDRSQVLVEAQLPQDVLNAFARKDVNLLHEHLRQGPLTQDRFLRLYTGAALSGCQDMFKNFLKNIPGVPEGTYFTFLQYSAFLNDTQTLEFLLTNLEINLRIVIDQRVIEAFILNATEGDAQDTFELLLEKYPEVNLRTIRTNVGETLLTLAAKNNSSTILQTLLERGFDQLQPDEDNNLPLESAIRYGSTEVARKLIDHLPNNIYFETLEELLRLTVEFNENDIFDYIIEKIEANPLLTPEERISIYETIDDPSPLIEAIESQNIYMLSRLLSRGARLPQTVFGVPLIYKSLYNIDLFKFLIEHGVDINAVDSYGLTSLHMVTIEENDLSSFRQQNSHSIRANRISLLIESGADTTLRDNKGKTAYEYAKTDEIRRLFTSKPFDPSIFLVAGQADDTQEIPLGRGSRTKRPADQNLDEVHKFRRF